MMRDSLSDIEKVLDIGQPDPGESDLDRALKIAGMLSRGNIRTVPEDILLFTLWTLAAAIKSTRPVLDKCTCMCKQVHEVKLLLQTGSGEGT